MYKIKKNALLLLVFCGSPLISMNKNNGEKDKNIPCKSSGIPRPPSPPKVVTELTSQGLTNGSFKRCIKTRIKDTDECIEQEIIYYQDGTTESSAKSSGLKLNKSNLWQAHSSHLDQLHFAFISHLQKALKAKDITSNVLEAFKSQDQGIVSNFDDKKDAE